MKKVFCLCLMLCVIFLSGCGKDKKMTPLEEIVKRDILIVGVKTDSEPFGFIDPETGINKGYDIDVAKYVAREILGSEKKVNFVPVTTASRIEAVTSGQVDMVIATMSITPQRQYLIDFSVPYFVAGQGVVVKKDSDVKTFSDLKHYKIAVLLNSTSEKNLRKIVPTAKIIGYKDYNAAFNSLLEGRVDAVSTDDVILSGFLHNYPDYRMLKNKISREPYAVAIKQYEDKQLKKTLDSIIIRMQQDGTIKELNEKWHLKCLNKQL